MNTRITSVRWFVFLAVPLLRPWTGARVFAGGGGGDWPEWRKDVEAVLIETTDSTGGADKVRAPPCTQHIHSGVRPRARLRQRSTRRQ